MSQSILVGGYLKSEFYHDTALPVPVKGLYFRDYRLNDKDQKGASHGSVDQAARLGLVEPSLRDG